MLPKEVFLSHSHHDRQFAAELAGVMRQHGIPVWFSVTHIVAARQWHDEIGAALDRCDWFVVILSPAAVNSIWVKRELLYALQQDRFEDHLLPVLYQPCDYQKLSWVLPAYQMVDFTATRESGYRELLRAWGVEYVAK